MFKILDKWGFNFYSSIHSVNSNFTSSRIYKNGAIIHQRTTNAFPFTIVWIWIFLYLIYEKCLHVLFRKMKYPMIARRRIIDGLWCSGFALWSMFYLKFFVPESLDSACLSQKPGYLELGLVLHKTFYLHRAIIELFTHRNWLQGWTNLLFCLIIHSFSEQKWLDIVTKLLFYKVSVIAVISICRVVSTIKNRAVIIKGLLGIYFMNWIYAHSIIIPEFQWWNTQGLKNDWLTLSCMWLWLICELLSEINHIRMGYLNPNQWIDAYLFSPPTQEMIDLKNICKKLRDSPRNKSPDPSERKKVDDLWQTISCAMIMKKKVKKFREAKANRALLQES